ncbi:MAG TPA: hypothetical protein VFT74_13710, partial [Isosphaeraceae bacterium]|nr:hypothetical protein [Isosphaeraceae bacterium]
KPKPPAILPARPPLPEPQAVETLTELVLQLRRVDEAEQAIKRHGDQDQTIEGEIPLPETLQILVDEAQHALRRLTMTPGYSELQDCTQLTTGEASTPSVASLQQLIAAVALNMRRPVSSVYRWTVAMFVERVRQITPQLTAALLVAPSEQDREADIRSLPPVTGNQTHVLQAFGYTKGYVNKIEQMKAKGEILHFNMTKEGSEKIYEVWHSDRRKHLDALDRSEQLRKGDFIKRFPR